MGTVEKREVGAVGRTESTFRFLAYRQPVSFLGVGILSTGNVLELPERLNC